MTPRIAASTGILYGVNKYLYQPHHGGQAIISRKLSQDETQANLNTIAHTEYGHIIGKSMLVNSGLRRLATCYRRHRRQEFRRFMNQVKESLPAGLDVDLVIDNYGTQGREVRNWLAPHRSEPGTLAPSGLDWPDSVR